MSRSGDGGAEAFCRREHPRLVGALSLYCGDPGLAEELAQEALIRAVDDWDTVSAMAAPGAWVHRVAMNLAASAFRRRGAERRARARLPRQRVHADPDPADAVAIRRAVAALPERQRRVLVLRYFLDWPLEDAAQAMGLTGQAAASLTYRAVQALRDELGEEHSAQLEEVSDGT